MSSPNQKPKTAIVIGAGVIGLTSALRLAEAGYRVTVLEQASGPCEGTSKANGAQLLYDRVGAMGSPGFLRSLPNSLRDKDQGIGVTGLANPAKWPWAVDFLRECTTQAWQDNTKGLLEIAKLSRRGMADIQSRYGLEFDWRKPGKLTLYASAEGLAAAEKSAAFEGQFGGRHEVLTAAQCLEHEPALKDNKRQIHGGIHLPDAEVGDCNKFGHALAEILCETLNGEIRYGVSVQKILDDGKHVRGVETSQGVLEADIYVLATGGAAQTLLPRFPNSKRITNVKGISLTFPLGGNPPNLSVTDTAGKFVVLQLGDKVRVAGYAIFSDDLTINPDLVKRLITKARALMPEAADYSVAPDIWVGARPQTPDDLPMIGCAGPTNLYVNAGHGSLGWTLAMGSADMLMDAITA